MPSFWVKFDRVGVPSTATVSLDHGVSTRADEEVLRAQVAFAARCETREVTDMTYALLEQA